MVTTLKRPFENTTGLVGSDCMYVHTRAACIFLSLRASRVGLSPRKSMMFALASPSDFTSDIVTPELAPCRLFNDPDHNPTRVGSILI